MARPRENPEDPKWSEGATERVTAPETQVPAVAAAPVAYVQQPRQLRVERVGAYSEPLVHHYPQVRGGVCEFCGILDPSVPSQFQYKLCPHYRGQNLWCSYCPAEKDPEEVVRSSKLEIVDHPDKPGQIIVVCDCYDCQKKHQDRFRI